MERTVLESSGRKARLGKRLVAILAMALCCAAASFAAEEIQELVDAATKVQDFFSATWLKVLCGVALMIEAFALVWSSGQGGLGQGIKKFAPVIAGTTILLNADRIIDFFWSGK